MSRITKVLIQAGSFLLFALPGASVAPAQMTIFNIPSTDTLSKSTFYAEADFITKPAPYSRGGFRSYGLRTVYGLNHKTEIGVNVFYTTSVSSPVGEVQFSLKRKLYNNERRGVALAAGTMVFVPLSPSFGEHSTVLAYLNLSKVITPMGGLRVTSGVYTIFGGGREFGTKNGVMLGVEQPIAKRFSFIADWYSGSNRLGYSAAGLNYNITKRQFILAGYNFGNSGRGNNAFSAFYGYTF